MRFSNQAIGAVMMALQKCILEKTDITEIFRGFEFIEDEEQGLIVTNPPKFEIDFDEPEDAEIQI